MDMQMGQLRSCDGAGMMAAVYMSQKQDKLVIGDLCTPKTFLPPDCLELDCQGTHIFSPGRYAQVHLGEIKSGNSSGTIQKATEQLGLGCSVMALVMQRVFNVPATSITRIGRIFLPQGSDRQGLSASQEGKALDSFRFSLYLDEI